MDCKRMLKLNCKAILYLLKVQNKKKHSLNSHLNAVFNERAAALCKVLKNPQLKLNYIIVLMKCTEPFFLLCSLLMSIVFPNYIF